MSRSTMKRMAKRGILPGLVLVLLALSIAPGFETPRPTPQQPLSWVYPRDLPPVPVVASTPTAQPRPTPLPTAAAPTPARAAPRVGIQAGHASIDDVPDELSQLRGDWGVSAGGWDEVAVNREIADLI